MPKVKRNYEALQHLKKIIEKVPEDKLDMRHRSAVTACRTVHCAGGLAAEDPWFQDRGLKLIAEDELGNYSFTYHDTVFEHDFTALELCFGLTKIQASILFGGDLYDLPSDSVSKTEVLKNIDRLLAGRQPLQYACARARPN